MRWDCMTNLKSYPGNLEALHGALAKTPADKIKSGGSDGGRHGRRSAVPEGQRGGRYPDEGEPAGELAGSLPFPDPKSVLEEDRLR
jgi:hypothetical protein